MNQSTLKKSMPLLAFALLAVAGTFAQGVEKIGRTSANASQVYFEGGGSGVFYTINYDGRFGKIENGLGFRAGVGGAGYKGEGYFAVPLQVNYLFGNNGQYLEVGGGVSYFSVSDFFDSVNGTVMGSAVLGFRKQPFGKKGLAWRAAFTPFIANGGIMPFAGASIGYRF